MKKVLLTILLIIQCSLLGATIINIPDDYSEIQDGVDEASEGDTILVQPGTYEENIEIEKPLTLGSLFLTTQDSSYIEQTIIDGDYKVSSIRIEDCQNGFTTICGFKIINGRGNSDLIRKGGGIYIDHSLVIIRNNIITDNKANQGCGIHAGHSEVYIQDNIIYNNTSLSSTKSDRSGGGISCDTAIVEIKRCDIYSNELGCAGGIYFVSTGFIVEECKIYDNRANTTGGGMFVRCGSYGKFINCEVLCNEADYAIGGGFSISQSEVTFCDVLIDGNSSVEGGSVGFFTARSNITFTNCTIVGNSSSSSDKGELICGDFSGDPSYCTITNSILYNNGPRQIEQMNCDILIQYSDIEGGEDNILKNSGIFTWGDGNIDYDPLFAEVEPFPYELSSSSPCINAGTPDTTGLHLPLTDLAGHSRVLQGRIDMGAYECEKFSVDPGVSIDEGISLYQNNPNPFRNGTEILFTVKDFSHIDDYSVFIYNTKGQLVRTFAGKSNTEMTKIAWDGTDRFGKQTSPGVYLYKLEYCDHAVVRKMVKLH